MNNLTRRYNIYSIDTLGYIINHIEEIKREESNLKVYEVGSNVIVKDQDTSDYICCNEDTGLSYLIIKNYHDIIKFYFKGLPEMHKVGNQIVSSDEIDSLLSSIQSDKKIISKRI